MYIFGGGDGKYWLNDLYIFDLDLQKWQLIEVSGKIPSKTKNPKFSWKITTLISHVQQKALYFRWRT